MLTVAKLLEATKGLDADAPVIVGIINGPRFNALDAFEEADADGMHLYIHCDEDPRDYKVSFAKINAELGFEITMTVPDGIREIAGALAASSLGDPFDPSSRN